MRLGAIVTLWTVEPAVPLEMRSVCEQCQAPLETGDLAFICSYECTFCPPCTLSMGQRCPNCAGELVRRPRRATAS